ncbi:hypothetical protein OAR16_00150 [bacterium]|nr:hypothetical protein [bacterium]
MDNDIYRYILENGLDFLLHTIHPPLQFEEDVGPGVLPKYLVLNLASATELIFKARLCKEHWSLIFQNPDKASVDCLHSGAFCSVSFDTCVVRLDRICGVSFRDQDRTLLEKMRKRRNCYQHYYVLSNSITKEYFVEEVLDFVLDFLERNFEENDFTVLANEALSDLRPLLTQFHRLKETRLKKLNSQLRSLFDEGRIERCPVCGEEALELNQVVKCHFCNWSASAVEAAHAQLEEEEGERKKMLFQTALFTSSPLPFVAINQCERCGVHAVVLRSSDEEGQIIESWKCYACGASNGT